MYIDFWYKDNLKDVTAIDCFFYASDCIYRGNMYKNGAIIGDYSAKDSVEIEKTFSFTGFSFT